MASNHSPSCSDDFVMLDANQTHDLPIRQRLSRDEAEQDQDIESSFDDDLEHISRPGSVRSLNTSSISSSPLPVPAPEENTTVSSLNLQADTPPQDRHASKNHQAERDSPAHDTHIPPLDVLLRTTTQAQDTCHTHASIDQEIMDQLIQHALTSRIEQEHGRGSSKDQELRQQTMARFRGLPTEYSFMKDSMTRLDGSKALFQGQQRSQKELEHIYHLVFTDVERIALNFVMECHIRHFQTMCTFNGPLMPLDREQLYQAMLQPGNREGRLLARHIQTRVLENLEEKPSYNELFNELRWQTRIRMKTPYSLRFHDRPREPVRSSELKAGSDWKSRIASDPQHQLANMRCIFYETICDLPNERYSQDDSYNCPISMLPTSVKREPPEDDVESDSCLSPPLKKFQADTSEPKVSRSEVFSMPNAPRLANRPLPAKDRNILSIPSQPLPPRVGRRQEVTINPEHNKTLQDYQMQLMLLEQQKMKKKQLETLVRDGKSISAESVAERSDECKNRLAETDQPQDKRSQLLTNRATRVRLADDKSKSTTLDHHFSAQSRGAAEGSSREYRQDTLLAQSTQLPVLSANATKDNSRFGGSDLPHVDNELGDEVGGATASETRRQYSFAPALRPEETSETINEWKVQIMFLEEIRKKEREAAKPDIPLQDYESQLMLLEQQCKLRCIQAKAEVVPPSCSQDLTSPNDHQEAPPTEPSSQPTKPDLQSYELISDYQERLELLKQQDRRRLQLREQQRLSRKDRAKTAAFGEDSSHGPPGSSGANEREIMKQPDYEQQLKALEEQNKKRVMLKREEEQRRQLESNDTAHGGERSVQGHLEPTGTYGLGATTLLEYQRKLMDREREQMKLIRQEQDGQRRSTVSNNIPSSRIRHNKGLVSSRGHRPCPMVVNRDGINWMAFGYEAEGTKMEYTIRIDIESVTINTLQQFFKDANCLHESCEGWMSAAEQIHQPQPTRTRRDNNRNHNSSKDSSRLDYGSASNLREKLRENEIAWGLAKLNPCLRGMEKKEVRRTAVKHFIRLGLFPTPVTPEKHFESGTATGNTDNVHAGPSRDPIVIESPDDIMNDTHLEETSSEEDDDDESCPFEGPPSEGLPIAFIDADGIRYLTFEFCLTSISSTQYDTGFYTVRTDVESVRNSISRPFSHDGCICQEEWKRQQSISLTYRHRQDCDVAMALVLLNPILQGKENEKLRWAAMMHYMFMADQQSSIPTDKKGYGRVLNPVVTHKVVEDGFVLFVRAPENGTPGAQCRYCNMIVNGLGYRGRATHMARCEGHFRKGEIRMGTD